MRNPNKQGVRIRRESKGRGGKCVSVIDGLPLDEKGMKTVLKKLKGQLGTGGAVKGGSVEIQGDHREKLLLLLEKEGHKARLAGG
ncbi:MAG: translation initiation factor [Zetaproteobacteria bacterium]|nr:translation initiation factor [Zetaproteobacteria bacterium]